MTEMDTRMALVEQLYNNLDKRLEKVENKLESLSNEMRSSREAMIKIIIGSTGTVIAGLLSTIVILLMGMN